MALVFALHLQNTVQCYLWKLQLCRVDNTIQFINLLFLYILNEELNGNDIAGRNVYSDIYIDIYVYITCVAKFIFNFYSEERI